MQHVAPLRCRTYGSCFRIAQFDEQAKLHGAICSSLCVIPDHTQLAAEACATGIGEFAHSRRWRTGCENLEDQVEGPAQECTVRGDQVTQIRFPLSGNVVRITRQIH